MRSSQHTDAATGTATEAVPICPPLDRSPKIHDYGYALRGDGFRDV